MLIRNIPIVLLSQVAYSTPVNNPTEVLFHNHTLNSENTQPRIIGGTSATRNEFPFLVNLTPCQNDGSCFLCGGALIAKNWVISAAHCMAPLSSYKDIHIKFGLHESSGNGESRVTVRSNKVTLHPNYNTDTLQNDIMLIEIPDGAHDIPESDWAKFTSDDFPAGQELTVAGWGVSGNAASDSPDMPSSLLKVDVPTISDSQCTAWLGNAFRPDETFCAGTSAGGIDSCQGDSGGPFFRKEGDDWIQYGLVSYGFGCAVAKQPGVYTQIKFYRTWVKNTSGVDVISNSGESDTTTQSSDGSTVAETTEDPCAGLEDLENTIDGINIVLGLFGIGDVPCSGRSQKFSVAILVFPSVALFGVFNYLF